MFASKLQCVVAVSLGRVPANTLVVELVMDETARLGISCAAHERIGNVGNVVVAEILAIDRGKEVVFEIRPGAWLQ